MYNIHGEVWKMRLVVILGKLCKLKLTELKRQYRAPQSQTGAIAR